eukprot:TRINITY_DN1103_c0_g1_i3.p1 TRINITY_DN1103_c0_g1~~TRINITY_DN1103_c0_g1_i3.p1  ORF type:complete len:362 (-),score=100.27 TRINITY_DN1103_c0_g1_i3:72-1157(-)
MSSPDPAGKLVLDFLEPSARLTLSQSFLKASEVTKITSNGGRYVIWLSDWFAMFNNKLDSDLKKIQTVAKYYIHVWRALGLSEENGVKFLLASEEIVSRPNDYWMLVTDIARRFDIGRMFQCGPAMGVEVQEVKEEVKEVAASEEEKTENAEGNEDESKLGAEFEVPTPRVLYPCMLAAVPFFLQADMCHLSGSQASIVDLCSEYAQHPAVSQLRNYTPPSLLIQPTLMSLKGIEDKGTDAEAVIFVDDDAAEVKKKITRSFCRPEDVANNPALDYLRQLIFPRFSRFEVKRKPESGGDKVYESLGEVEADFASGALHPGDLKPALIAALNELLEPVRQYFSQNQEAKAVLAAMKKLKLTK